MYSLLILFLGEIPLRQLVYRVLELPPSLRPHVYDFGRLNDKTEVEYTKKIVENRVTDLYNLASFSYMYFGMVVFNFKFVLGS